MSKRSFRLQTQIYNGRLCATVLSLALLFGTWFLWKRYAPPLQVFYLKSYCQSLVTGGFGMSKPRTYALVEIKCGKGYCVATGADLQSPERLRSIVVRNELVVPSRLSSFLAETVYKHSLMQQPGYVVGGATLFFVLAFAIGTEIDRRTLDRYKNGVLKIGRRVVSPADFNRRQRGWWWSRQDKSGYEIWTENKHLLETSIDGTL